MIACFQGRGHSLVAQVREAAELSFLSSAMKLDRVERDWRGASSDLAALHKVALDGGLEPLDGEHLKNHLAVIRRGASGAAVSA
ncbi:MAG: hypothetical protein ACI970_001265 [Myxococcota bacterium]|jgi:hypothetical protein